MKKIISSLLALCLIVGLVACGESTATVVDANSLSKGQYVLYYTNANASTIIEYVYNAENESKEDLVPELINSMKNVSAEGSVSVMPEKMTFNHVDFIDGILCIHFSGGFNSFTNASRLAFVSSMTKALCQIDGVDGIQIYDDEGLMKNSNGDAYDVLKPEQFIDNLGDVNLSK